MAYDRTEGKLKLIGLIGSIFVGLSGAAVGTWKSLKEADKIKESKPKEEQPKVKEQPADKAD